MLMSAFCFAPVIHFLFLSAPTIRGRSLVFTDVTSVLEVFLNVMRYINPRFTYLLTYLLSSPNFDT